MSTHTARPEQEVAYQELVALVNKHAGHLSALEMLAVAANMLGKLLALQDQREITPEQAMQVIAHNIEMGNRQVVEELSSTTKGRA